MKAYHLHHRSTRKRGPSHDVLLSGPSAAAATFEVSGVAWRDRYDRLNRDRRRRDILARVIAALFVASACLAWELLTR